MAKRETRIWTVGHSTRALADLMTLLTSYEIQAVADVRRFASSRKFPHFNQMDLSRALESVGVQYMHLLQLGGRRKPRPDSPNGAWRNRRFRGYADHMETEEFRAGIEKLVTLAARQRTAVMCSEAVWWRCHRALLADYLKSKEIDVIHIMGVDKLVRRRYSTPAEVRIGQLSYGAEEKAASFLIKARHARVL
jgi:uncharacterized protein (DUF488 family)